MPELAVTLTSLKDMGVADLRILWKERFGDPPPIRTGDVLRRSLAEKIQEAAFGVDRDLEKRINRLTARYRPKARPQIRTARYRSGTRLSREWNGRCHVVEVVQDGFVWEGERYASLSVIARKITGVRWNGPRFFGLRGRGAA